MIEPNTACWYGDWMVRVVACFDKTTCNNCKGKGVSPKNEDCDFCDGKGFRMRQCSICSNEEEAKKTCVNCGGSGQIKSRCRRCGGKGIARCPECHGEGFIKEAPVMHSKKNYCELSKEVENGETYIKMSKLEPVRVGDVVITTGHIDDQWIKRVFVPGTKAVVVKVDHDDVRLPVRIQGERVDGKTMPRWAQFDAVRKW